jgi:hypothetical protein
LTATTIITPPPPQQSNSTPSTPTSPTKSTSSSPPSPAAAIPCWIIDSFVFDDYAKKVNQVSQFVVESKFIEATQKHVEYGNREFLRSFQLRPHGNSKLRDSRGRFVASTSAPSAT